MIIKAVKFRKDGYYSQPFAFGGEEGKDAFDEQIIYRSSLQNFLIDTGKEVILIDTGFKSGMPAPARKALMPARPQPKQWRRVWEFPILQLQWLPPVLSVCSFRLIN